MSEETEETAPVKRLPKWTVVGNLKRHETTPWIGTFIEFFDDKAEAEKCHERHRKAGDCGTLRPFHSSDESRLHILDSAVQKG